MSAMPNVAPHSEPVRARPRVANGDHRSQSMSPASSPSTVESTTNIQRDDALADYRVAYLSRQVCLVGLREVFRGRAKFGVFGAGKEVAQVALARAFQAGDQRAGYYRDQTWALATGMATAQQLFAQLYGDTDPASDPHKAGRSMNAHFATRLLDDSGHWLPQTDRANTSSDISPTSGQMARLVGLAHASVLYRELESLHHLTQFSQRGSEVAFGTIGNGACAEGHFWEAVNAIGVLRAPAVLSIWDDGYAISVTNEHAFAKPDLSELLEGFRRGPGEERGFNLYRVPGWNYPELVAAYRAATDAAREQHIPAIVHVVEMTQPQGHSSSGSHERYKPAERMAWEEEFDPVRHMRQWLLDQEFATESDLDALEAKALVEVQQARDAALEAVRTPLAAERDALVEKLEQIAQHSAQSDALASLVDKLRQSRQPQRKPNLEAAHRALLLTRDESTTARADLLAWYTEQRNHHREETYGSHLYSRSTDSPLRVPAVAPIYSDEPREARGFELLRDNFDAILANDPRVFIFGEDVGQLGDVNQGVAGLQAKHGKLRVADTGIRETTIVGQAIGMALRGLRPIAEIQYLDYVFYAIDALSDDLACLHWRTKGGQKAPVILRTRGHRLEGIYHSGSPMAALVDLLRGMHIAVPRNMTQAAGFYNTLLRGDDPALVIETLNAYRLPESMPTNLGDFTIPLGVPETLREGSDVTLVTYGACCRIALAAADTLADLGISLEIIDVQTLLPFDIHHAIVESVKRTNCLVVFDEDMPGGASAYMLREILEVQGAYWHLDSEPRTITSPPHRPSYSTDGDYFSKPNVEDVVMAVYDLMHESEPSRYPRIWD